MTHLSVGSKGESLRADALLESNIGVSAKAGVANCRMADTASPTHAGPPRLGRRTASQVA